MAVCRPLPLQYYRKGAEIESTESSLAKRPTQLINRRYADRFSQPRRPPVFRRQASRRHCVIM